MMSFLNIQQLGQNCQLTTTCFSLPGQANERIACDEVHSAGAAIEQRRNVRQLFGIPAEESAERAQEQHQQLPAVQRASKRRLEPVHSRHAHVEAELLVGLRHAYQLAAGRGSRERYERSAHSQLVFGEPAAAAAARSVSDLQENHTGQRELSRVQQLQPVDMRGLRILLGQRAGE